MAKKPLLDIQHLTVRAGERTLLHDVSFSVLPGQIVAIVGPNGSGKTTLLRAILGLTPHIGEILWNEKPTIGYVPQRIEIDDGFPLTVEELLLLQRARHPVWRHDTLAHQVVAHALHDVGAEKLIEKPVGVLSGGELQRVLMANALVSNPSVLVLDEPSSGIDIEGEEAMYSLLYRLAQQRNLTVLLVSHDLDVVFQYAHKVVCVNRRLICEGVPKRVLTEKTLAQAYAHPGHFPHTTHDHHVHD